MWVILNNSFISCVQDSKDPDLICVRARVEGDIKKAFDGEVSEVKSYPGSDYAFRTWVTKEQLITALKKAVDNIDYTNFKDSVNENDRHNAYLDIWAIMYEFQHKRLGK